MVTNEQVIELSRKYSSHYFKELYKTDEVLGVILKSKSTIFKIWSPIATAVSVNLFKTGDKSEKAFEKHDLKMKENGVWEVRINRNLDEIFYTYNVTALGETNETADIYAKACGVNGERSMVVNLSDTNPEFWKNDKFIYPKNRQPIIYELHIKDFSFDESSGVKKEYRGKYLAFTQENTYYDKNKHHPTCISHLKKLGITHVHILPMYDFATVDEMDGENDFNWGYDPVNYNVPDGSYSTNPHKGKVRINELKQMIKALHNNGIGVIMDVVYNHTYQTEKSYFHYSVPYYYHRTTLSGEFGNASGCGNETASERFMFRKYMIDSILYWATEYHIDGFRFDLMGIHDVDTMNLIREKLDKLPNGKNLLMYGEPWFALPPSMEIGAYPAIKTHLNRLNTRIAIFCDDTRDTIKGSTFDVNHTGFANGGNNSENMPSLVKGWCDSWAVGNIFPRQIISYISAHDNLSLYDKLLLSTTDSRDFDSINQNVILVNKFCAGILFTSCGASFFQAGEEFARTKKGDENSYRSSPKINALDWERSYVYKNLVYFYSKLIEFRKTIPVFMNGVASPIDEIEFLQSPSNKTLAFKVLDENNREILIFYNAEDNKEIFSIPDGNWKLFCDGEEFYDDTNIIFNQTAAIESKSITILKKI